MNSLLVAGIDVGSRMTKAAILDESGKVLSRVSIPTGADLTKASRMAFESAINIAGLSEKDISYVASTGYGRYQVPFRQVQITDFTSNAYGAHMLFPNTEVVLDVGAQNARAMHIEKSGKVKRFKMNDKCAAGAGRFIERCAKALELELEEVGPLSLRSKDPQEISSICAVLAESEIINLVTEGKTIEDILMGAHRSIAERLVAMLRQVGIDGEITLTGGVAKNIGMVRAIEEKTGKPVHVHQDAEYIGAIGSAGLGIRRLTTNN